MRISLCVTGLGRMCFWPGRAAQPGTPAAPACQPQLLAALAHLRFISASLLPSYLQDQPSPHASRLCRFPFFPFSCSRHWPGDDIFMFLTHGSEDVWHPWHEWQQGNLNEFAQGMILTPGKPQPFGEVPT